MTKEQLIEELKDLQETIKLFEMVLGARKKLEELGIKLDKNREVVPYPYPRPYPCPCMPPYNPIWTVETTTGTPLQKETTFTVSKSGYTTSG